MGYAAHSIGSAPFARRAAPLCKADLTDCFCVGVRDGAQAFALFSFFCGCHCITGTLHRRMAVLMSVLLFLHIFLFSFFYYTDAAATVNDGGTNRQPMLSICIRLCCYFLYFSISDYADRSPRVMPPFQRASSFISFFSRARELPFLLLGQCLSFE